MQLNSIYKVEACGIKEAVRLGKFQPQILSDVLLVIYSCKFNAIYIWLVNLGSFISKKFYGKKQK